MHFDELNGHEHWSTRHQFVTEDEIVRFAHAWDPQPFHVDAKAAKHSVFGGLVASGLHTLLISYRLFDELCILGDAAIAGLGYEDVRFAAPVRPGDRLKVDVSIHSLRESRSRDRGVVAFGLRTLNQEGTTVLAARLCVLAAKAQPGMAAGRPVVPAQ